MKKINYAMIFCLGLCVTILLGAGAGIVYNEDTLIIKNWVQIGSEAARAAKLKIVGSSATEKTLVVQMKAAQSANAIEVQNSAGSSVWAIGPTGAPTQSGKFTIGTDSATTSTVSVAALSRASGTQTYQYRFDDGAASGTSSLGKFTCNATDCSDIKNFGLFINAGHPTGTTGAITGDSRDGVLKVSYSNHAASSTTEFEAHGSEFNIANRSGGTLKTLKGHDTTVQNVSGATAPNIVGSYLNLENGGTNATSMIGVDVELESSVAKPTAKYGIEVRNTGTYADAADAAYHVSDSGDNTGFNYGLDCAGASIVKAPVRLATNIVVLTGAGVPTDGVAGTGLNFAGIGSMYIRSDGTTDAVVYVNIAVSSSPVWKALDTSP